MSCRHWPCKRNLRSIGAVSFAALSSVDAQTVMVDGSAALHAFNPICAPFGFPLRQLESRQGFQPRLAASEGSCVLFPTSRVVGLLWNRFGICHHESNPKGWTMPWQLQKPDTAMQAAALSLDSRPCLNTGIPWHDVQKHKSTQEISNHSTHSNYPKHWKHLKGLSMSLRFRVVSPGPPSPVQLPFQGVLSEPSSEIMVCKRQSCNAWCLWMLWYFMIFHDIFAFDILHKIHTMINFPKAWLLWWRSNPQ